MHARNRTWPLGSDPAERCRQRTLPVQGGDGSTLSLDFTTGVLDSRITFTRASNATFINSSGLVEWANANIYWNTAFEGLSGTNPSLTGSGWGYALTSGNAVFNSDGTVTMTTTASDRRALQRSSGFSGAGLRVVASVDVTIHNGSLQASQVITTGTPTNAQHYVNGLIWNSSHPNWSGGILPTGTQFNISYATDSVTGSTTNIYFGVGCSFAIAGSATFSNPRWTMWKGSGSVPYYPNTSATNNSTANYYKSNDYQAPRFDYDPTSIGTPRGLLIEGSATNLLSYSEDFSNAAWTKSGTNGAMTLTGTAPDNNATSRLLEENTTSYAKHSLERSVAISAGIHTMSVWLKEPSSNSRRYAHIQLADGQATAARYTIVVDVQTGQIVANGANNGTAGAPTGTGHSITSYPGGWYRVTISMNHVSSPSYQAIVLGDSASLFGGNNQPFYSATTPYKGLIVWGAQVETGSGASSYIPTGASTVQRAVDICYIDNISSWYTQGIGTMLFSGRPILSTTRNYLGLSTGTNPPRLLMYGSNPTEVILFLENSTSSNLVFPSGSTTLGSVNRMASSFEQAGYSCVLNGGTVGTSTASSPAMPTSGITRMNIGMRNDQLNQFNGHVVEVKYWPYRLPNAQLQSITT